MSGGATHICQCDQPGDCPVFKASIVGRRYEICRGTSGLTEEAREKYVKRWMGEAADPAKEKERKARRDRASAGGPGTELKNFIAWFGQRDTPGCQCKTRAAEMDRRGPDWCDKHVSIIVGWLKEAANERGLPFFELPAKILVRRAIKNARAKAGKLKSVEEGQ
jgi:hypothetical protein